MGKVKSLELPIKPLTQSPRIIYVYLPNDYDENRKEKFSDEIIHKIKSINKEEKNV